MLRVGELGHRVDVGTAAEALARERLLQPVEGAEDLLARRRVGGRDIAEAALQVAGDQVVLGREIGVQRALADVGFGRHRVHADRADALPVEQLVGGGQDPFAG